MSSSDRSAEERARPAVDKGQSQVTTKVDLVAAVGRPASADSDERRSEADFAATTLDFGSPGIGIGGREEPGDESGSQSDPLRGRDPQGRRDRGGEVAGAAAGTVGGAVVGGLVAGPPGAVVGAVVGGAGGNLAGRSAEGRHGEATDAVDEDPDPLT